MKTYDVMSVDIVCAKKDTTIIKVATRIVLGLLNVIPIRNDDKGNWHYNYNRYIMCY